MNYTIRPFKHSDFKEIKSWWDNAGETLSEGIMTPESSFILEVNNTPALSLSVFLTQSKGIAFINFFIKNPKFKGINLEELGHILWNHCFKFAKDAGYGRTISFSAVPTLTEKYKRFGLEVTKENLTSLVRVL